MTRLQAIRKLRQGGRLERTYDINHYGISEKLFVRLNHQDICDFPRARLNDHHLVGPVHCLFLSGGQIDIIHITPYQTLNFIRRNYPRK